MKKNLMIITLLALCCIGAGCKKKHNNDPNCTPLTSGGLEVVDHTEMTVQNVIDEVKLLPDDSSYYDFNDFYRETLDQESGTLKVKPIAHEVVRYTSTDNTGAKVQLTGLLIYPWNLPPFGRVSAPIVSVNHGTQILKRFAPSKWKSASWGDWKNFPEMVIADIMAAYYNWIIIMPDYQGMGDDVNENHPYVVRERLANATADMVEAAQKSLSCERNDWVQWNGKTFLYGFSEGGYVTMAAARELEARKVSLAGVVCMDGPYDLSGTMLDVMLGDSPFPVPYFLPMLLVGYNTMFPDAYQYSAMLKEPYRTDIPAYTTGFYDETVVNSKMPPDRILKKVFTDAFYDSLKNPNSLAYKILSENNSYIGWTPKSNMLLWHCQNDDCVPFGNFTAAKKRFTDLGLSNIDYVEWPPVELNPDRGTIHVTVAPRAFYEGSLWIYHHSK
ncbi:MAG: alpha/beta hydrolase [Bacteroidetes bacterium]|nr:alpha/beta hydrolase [Bacteroidota bacterium]